MGLESLDDMLETFEWLDSVALSNVSRVSFAWAGSFGSAPALSFFPFLSCREDIIVMGN